MQIHLSLSYFGYVMLGVTWTVNILSAHVSNSYWWSFTQDRQSHVSLRGPEPRQRQAHLIPPRNTGTESQSLSLSLPFRHGWLITDVAGVLWHVTLTWRHASCPMKWLFRFGKVLWWMRVGPQNFGEVFVMRTFDPTCFLVLLLCVTNLKVTI